VGGGLSPLSPMGNEGVQTKKVKPLKPSAYEINRIKKNSSKKRPPNQL